jgi:hypothetical protein
MRLTQERIIAIIDYAVKYSDAMIEIRERIVPELRHISSTLTDGTQKEAIDNVCLFILNLTEIDITAIRDLAIEKAHFNSTRIKHNEYMRSAYYRRKAKNAHSANPLDLGMESPGINDDPMAAQREVYLTNTRQNNEHPRQNNVAIEEVPLLARIEAQAAEYEKSNQPTQNSPSESEEALKAKFGPDFHPLPARVGLKRNQT